MKAQKVSKTAKVQRGAKSRVKTRETAATSRASRRPAAAAAAKPAAPKKPVVVEKPRPLADAVLAYEQGIRLMYAENFEKAIKVFQDLIDRYPEETEIQAAAKGRIQACAKKLELNARAVYRSADDHYNVGVALMNRGEIDDALAHFQSALKMAPKSDHVLYAMAAANALKGNSAQAVAYLKQSIHYRNENRFQAASDADFTSLAEDPAFKELLNTSGK